MSPFLPHSYPILIYEQFRQRLQAIAQRQAPVHFHIRLDAAGQYADNL
jgi:hypothetical protein